MNYSNHSNMILETLSSIPVYECTHSYFLIELLCGYCMQIKVLVLCITHCLRLSTTHQIRGYIVNTIIFQYA